MPDATSRFSLAGKAIFHYMGTSTLSSYVVVTDIALARIRSDAPFRKVCYIGCGVTTGVGAVLFSAKVEAGANVAVFGLGGIGVNVIQAAKMAGADKVIGVDINPARQREPAATSAASAMRVLLYTSHRPYGPYLAPQQPGINPRMEIWNT
ncbi:Zn-dependent alcohol dehydrogenase [Massilia umbonata]|uniref:Zn-dependent alcohol dehydrogenase n=1 Tax=Pseudoduganella umbonata TaxID=864828 RepID=A0A7W5EDI1_9BURK|nr:Zn-dependent alcohol dehydrogenase [Pseudoduganella umbonata]